MNLAIQSLAATSKLAAQLWQQLELAETTEEIDQLLRSIWNNQENQELAIDFHADLADQIDAEIAALRARKQYLTELHDTAINKLTGWRERLDQTVLFFNEGGVLNSENVGKQRRITVKENPPTCEVSIDPKELPAPYRRIETKTVISADKKAIADAWKRGIPVEGTRVFRKQRVVYSLLRGNNLNDYQANNPSLVSGQPEAPAMTLKTKRKKRHPN
ncbi:MAG: siphovirus Gp157 family protein [Oscillatoriaceae cyanobacterium Prado104]|jgi:hypothetical protein|nr:siphovirus Gp157 family protein [Oscillatoriaceae cyanobacterium Prado104]